MSSWLLRSVVALLSTTERPKIAHWMGNLLFYEGIMFPRLKKSKFGKIIYKKPFNALAGSQDQG